MSASPPSIALLAFSVRPWGSGSPVQALVVCFSIPPVRRIDVGLLVRYIVAIGLLAFVYTTLQLLRHGVRLTGGQDLQPKTGLLVDFAGDQVPLPSHSQRICSEFCLGDSCSIFLFPIVWHSSAIHKPWILQLICIKQLELVSHWQLPYLVGGLTRITGFLHDIQSQRYLNAAAKLLCLHKSCISSRV